MRGSPEALLVTGAYGVGKSLLAANLGDELERRRARFAAIDLDWLAWFDAGEDIANEERVFLANLTAVVANYRSIGIRWYVLAGSTETADQATAIEAAIDMPLRVLRLTAPIDVIERRLRADKRAADFEVALGQVQRDFAAGIAERTLDGTPDVATLVADVLAWLDWT
jgi:hypothetical protein